jgi:hypothetical protein
VTLSGAKPVLNHFIPNFTPETPAPTEPSPTPRDLAWGGVMEDPLGYHRWYNDPRGGHHLLTGEEEFNVHFDESGKTTINRVIIFTDPEDPNNTQLFFPDCGDCENW